MWSFPDPVLSGETSVLGAVRVRVQGGVERQRSDPASQISSCRGASRWDRGSEPWRRVHTRTHSCGRTVICRGPGHVCLWKSWWLVSWARHLKATAGTGWILIHGSRDVCRRMIRVAGPLWEWGCTKTHRRRTWGMCPVTVLAGAVCWHGLVCCRRRCWRRGN